MVKATKSVNRDTTVERFWLTELTDSEVSAIAQMACMDETTWNFADLAHDAERKGKLFGCTNLRDYAIALLQYRINYLLGR